jgi:acyl carrier protein
MAINVIAALFKAFDEVNPLLAEDQRLIKEKDTPILNRLNSLGLVNLIVAVENQIKEEFNVTISLTDEKALMANPFQTTSTLANYITSLLK